MSTVRSERLKAARAKAGYASASDAAKAFGWGVSGYIHHENGTRNFGLDVARKYGRAFRVKPGWLLAMEGVDDGPVNGVTASAKLLVEDAVAAGVWRELSDEPHIRLEIDTPPPVPDMKRFGFIVEGYSMDLHYPPGTVLDCISIFTNGVEPENGDHVIVERRRPDGLRERTVKEFQAREDGFYLVPRSTRSEYQEIHIGKPDRDMLDDEEVSVIGFVVSNIPPHSLKLLTRLGKVKDLLRG